LTDPVVGVYKAGDDGWAVRGGAGLPVAEGLVARHPHPLSVQSVAQAGVGEHGVAGVVGIEAVGVELALEVAERLAVAGQEVILSPGGVACESLSEADTCSARDGGVCGKSGVGGVAAGLAGVHVLDVVAPVEEARVAVELVALPEPWSVLESGHEVIVVLDVLHAELSLQGEDLVCGAGGEYFVHVVDDESDVCAAVLGHALLDGKEVAPVVGDRLDRCAGRVVSPDGARVDSFHPGSECTRIGATGEDPWDVLGVAVRVASERQTDLFGEVCQVVDGVFQGQVFEVLGREVCEGCGSAPVAVLQNNCCSSDLLGDDSSGAVGAEIAGVAGSVDLAGGEEDDWGACVLSVVGVSLVLRLCQHSPGPFQ